MKNLIGIFIFLCASLVVLSLFVGVSKTKPLPELTELSPYMYNNKNVSIKKIHITVFYFIPKDVKEYELSDWKEYAENHLKNLITFHTLQFQNTSEITYTFSPSYVIGEKDKVEYEGILGSYEDYDALIPIKEEITKRVLTKGGDLYIEKNNEKQKDIRNVFMVVFEGNGAAGNGDFALVSRKYLTDKEYVNTGSTFLAHEFYHTLGIPDNYQSSIIVHEDKSQSKTSLVTKKDIMGQVNIPLTSTYLDIDTLKNMGI